MLLCGNSIVSQQPECIGGEKLLPSLPFRYGRPVRGFGMIACGGEVLLDEVWEWMQLEYLQPGQKRWIGGTRWGMEGDGGSTPSQSRYQMFAACVCKVCRATIHKYHCVQTVVWSLFRSQEPGTFEGLETS
jgi:hypothetical protein